MSICSSPSLERTLLSVSAWPSLSSPFPSLPYQRFDLFSQSPTKLHNFSVSHWLWVRHFWWRNWEWLPNGGRRGISCLCQYDWMVREICRWHQYEEGLPGQERMYWDNLPPQVREGARGEPFKACKRYQVFPGKSTIEHHSQTHCLTGWRGSESVYQ